MSLTLVAAFAVALATTLGVTPLARRAALKLQVVDMPGERKIHTDPVPYLGGVGIVVAFSVAVVTGAVARGLTGSLAEMAVLVGGGLLLSLMGLWDDLRVVPGWIKVPVELLLGVALFLAGSKAQLFNFWPLDLAVTVAWVIGITNAVNYMDNMDGLSAGVVAIAATFFTALAGYSGQILVGGLSAALAGCALGFLWHNRPPAKIFMGDAGSLFMGFLLAGLGLELRFENIARVTFFVPVAIMGVAILDALMVSYSRVRRGLSPIQPGRDHISHRLMKVGIPQRATLGLIYFAAAACGWLGVTIAFASPAVAYMLMAWLVAVGVFFAALLIKVDV